MDHPARYALVEIENVHDEGLEFEPIHRVLFNLKTRYPGGAAGLLRRGITFISMPDIQVDDRGSRPAEPEAGKSLGSSLESMTGVVEIANPTSNLAVGSLAELPGRFLDEGGAEKIDYVHGLDVFTRLGRQPGNVGFYLPCMDKNDLFKTVILDGALPRKTFSMGEAHEKRFYMESRKIVP